MGQRNCSKLIKYCKIYYFHDCCCDLDIEVLIKNDELSIDKILNEDPNEFIRSLNNDEDKIPENNILFE